MIKVLKNILVIPQESKSEEETLEEFKQNYLENKDFLRSSIYWMVRSDDVDDLVQSTFVKAWQHYSKFKKSSSFKTWIYRIAMNTTYDYLKKNKNKVNSFDIDEVPTSDILEEKEVLRDLITKALQVLNPKHREVFILHYKLGYKVSEIAKLQKIAQGTVKSRLHHAREQFTYFLKENGVENER